MKTTTSNSTGISRSRWWARKSISFRIVTVVSAVTVLTMGALTVAINNHNQQAAQKSVQREMAAALSPLEQSLQVVYESAVERGDNLMEAYVKALGGEPYLDGSTVMTGEAGEVARLVNSQGETMNGNIDLQMRINDLTGSDAAVILRTDKGWVRVATLLADDKGNRRIGSRVPDSDHLVRTLEAGESHSGLVQRNGRWYAMSIKPLKDKSGRAYGGLTVRVDVHAEVSRLMSVMTKIKVADHGVVGVLRPDPEGKGWVYAGGPRTGEKATPQVSQIVDDMQVAPNGFKILDLGNDRGKNFVSWIKVPNWNWTMYSSGPRDAFMAESDEELVKNLIMMLVGTLSIAVLAGFFARSMLRPVGSVVQSLEKVGAGDLSADIARAPDGSNNEVHQLLESLNQTQESLAATVRAVRESVEQINVGSSEILAGNTDLSTRTEQQAASLEETAASMDELAGTVRQTADHAKSANDMAASASDKARRSGEAVGKVVDTMNAISQSSGRIAEIVSVIDGIAFQTNILALNAAVEAARAGDQGRGFAVVAAEVRALAQRSATAAKEIKDLIEDSLKQVAEGADQVGSTRATIDEMVSVVEKVTELMGEISNATQQQSVGIEQVNQAVTQMDSVTQQNAALVEQAAAAAGSLEQQARNLVQAVAVFKMR